MIRPMIRLFGSVLTAAALSGGAAGLPSGAVGEPAAPVKLDVILVATDLTIVNAKLTLAGVTRDDVVYDLGCGDAASSSRPPRSSGRAGWAWTSTPSASGKPRPTFLWRVP